MIKYLMGVLLCLAIVWPTPIMGQSHVKEKCMKIEELERIEKAVRTIYGPSSVEEAKRLTKEERERFYDEKVIYYVKLGLSAKELEKKAAQRKAPIFINCVVDGTHR